MNVPPSLAPRLVRALLLSALVSALVAASAAPARAQEGDPNACDGPSDSPNVIVGDLFDIIRWGKVGDVTAFSIGTFSCNVGTCWLDWLAGGGAAAHPTIGQNAFKLEDGRFEQVGQSWLKHGFYALSDRLCSPDCIATDGEHLGVNCSDPYTAGLNGSQGQLGPKFEVNPVTGEHPHPVSMQGLTGNEIFKRLQIHDADLDPALNPGARWFVEGQYIAADDARAKNQHDNASYREIAVIDGGGGVFDIAFAGPTRRTQPAIFAWAQSDPEVVMTSVDDPEGGRYWLAAKATDLGNGTWHYEYAVHNLDSRRSAGSFTVPVPAAIPVSDIGFHDADYHSGEPFDLTDWNPIRASLGALTWSTVPYGTNPNANALRWGTLDNFRFDSPAPPGPALVTLGMFRPGSPGDARRIVALLIGPTPCNGDGRCDAVESCASCPGECTVGPDNDGDGLSWCDDCDDNDARTWSVPGEARLLLARRGPAGEVLLDWLDPLDTGALAPAYEVLSAQSPDAFGASPTCLRSLVPTDRTLIDVDAPTAGPFLSYLVRARSRCAFGVGTTGTNSFLVPRIAADCP